MGRLAAVGRLERSQTLRCHHRLRLQRVSQTGSVIEEVVEMVHTVERIRSRAYRDQCPSRRTSLSSMTSRVMRITTQDASTA